MFYRLLWSCRCHPSAQSALCAGHRCCLVAVHHRLAGCLHRQLHCSAELWQRAAPNPDFWRSCEAKKAWVWDSGWLLHFLLLQGAENLIVHIHTCRRTAKLGPSCPARAYSSFYHFHCCRLHQFSCNISNNVIGIYCFVHLFFHLFSERKACGELYFYRVWPFKKAVLVFRGYPCVPWTQGLT